METMPYGELGRLAKRLDNLETVCDTLLHWLSRLEQRLENVETRPLRDDQRQIVREEVKWRKGTKG